MFVKALDHWQKRQILQATIGDYQKAAVSLIKRNNLNRWWHER